MEREEFAEAVNRATSKGGEKTMTGTDATQWMTKQGGPDV